MDAETMTREDVLRIAEACGLGTNHGDGLWGAGFAEPAKLVAFAHAIAARPAAPMLVDGKLPRHKFWGAGESDCPPELKAPNGELHTMRCKVCGDGWRKSSDVCFGTAGVTAAPAPQPSITFMYEVGGPWRLELNGVTLSRHRTRLELEDAMAALQRALDVTAAPAPADWQVFSFLERIRDDKAVPEQHRRAAAQLHKQFADGVKTVDGGQQ